MCELIQRQCIFIFFLLIFSLFFEILDFKYLLTHSASQQNVINSNNTFPSFRIY